MPTSCVDFGNNLINDVMWKRIIKHAQRAKWDYYNIVKCSSHVFWYLLSLCAWVVISFTDVLSNILDILWKMNTWLKLLCQQRKVFPNVVGGKTYLWGDLVFFKEILQYTRILIVAVQNVYIIWKVYIMLLINQPREQPSNLFTTIYMYTGICCKHLVVRDLWSRSGSIFIRFDFSFDLLAY